MKLQPGERPEDLYQRLVSFIDDNLLTTDCNVKHHSTTATKDEEVSPSLENVTVLLWLERLHIGLPSLVKQRYGAELRNQTLASIKPEISIALNSLMEELSSNDDARVGRAQSPRWQVPRGNPYDTPTQNYGKPRNTKYCHLCRTANRSGFDKHYLSQCKFLPESDRRRMNSKVRNVEAVDHEEDYEDELIVVERSDSAEFSSNAENTENNMLFIDPPSSMIRRVASRKSPRMQCFYGHIPITLILDTGAEITIMSVITCQIMGITFVPTNQGANQVDNKTPLPIIGEVKEIKIIKGPHVFILDALITSDDIGDIIAGEPFLERNDIAVRPAKRQIIIKGKEIITYSNL